MSLFKKNYIYFLIGYGCLHSAREEVRGQLAGVGSPPPWVRGSNAGERRNSRSHLTDSRQLLLGPVFPNLRLLPSDTPGGASLLWDSALTSISKVPYDVGRWLKQSILVEVSLEMPLK